MHPADRLFTGDTTYRFEREWLSIMLEETGVTVDQLGIAYFSDTDDAVRRDIEQKFNKLLNKLFPEHAGKAFYVITAEYEEAYCSRRSEEWLDQFIDQIYIRFEQDADMTQ